MLTMVLALFAPIFIVALLGVSGIVLPKAFLVVTMIVTFVPGLVMSFSLQRGARINKRYQDALSRGDIDEILAIRNTMDGPVEKRNRLGHAAGALGDAELLLRFERWPEARDALANLDFEVMPDETRPGIASMHAYAMAHAGESARAIPLLQDALRLSESIEKYPVEKRWYLRARLGIALSLAGRHEDAIDVLDPLVGEDVVGELRDWTAAMFFLAQSLRGAGATDDAMGVYRHAAEGDGPFVARARAASDLATSAPLRHGGGPALVQELEDEDDEVAEKLKRVAIGRRA